MDTGETYIKMRLAATPDLGMGAPPELAPGAEVTWLTTFVFVDRVGNLYYSDKERTCQLDRQDQLQEMVRPNWGKLPYLLTLTFNEAVNGGSCSYVWDNGKLFTSMGQLWLAFVMSQLHQKKWSSSEWIKET